MKGLYVLRTEFNPKDQSWNTPTHHNSTISFSVLEWVLPMKWSLPKTTPYLRHRSNLHRSTQALLLQATLPLNQWHRFRRNLQLEMKILNMTSVTFLRHYQMRELRQLLRWPRNQRNGMLEMASIRYRRQAAFHLTQKQFFCTWWTEDLIWAILMAKLLEVSLLYASFKDFRYQFSIISCLC